MTSPTRSSFYTTTGPSYQGTNPASSDNNAAVVVVIDGGGAPIVSGMQADIEIPFGATINSVTLLADAVGSAVVDIWKAPFASFPPTNTNSICGSDLPTISSAQTYQDTTLTGWTTSISPGDTLRFNVNSASTIKRLAITLQITKG